MAKGRLRAAAEIDTNLRLRPGWSKVKASAVMPPIEAPTTVWARSMRRWSSTWAPAAAMSSRHSTGKSSR